MLFLSSRQPGRHLSDSELAGELKRKIEALASSLKFPLSQLFVVDGSSKSH